MKTNLSSSCPTCGHPLHRARKCGAWIGELTYSDANGDHREAAVCACGNQDASRPTFEVIQGAKSDDA